VTVTAGKGISVEEMRSRVASHFKTDDVSVSRGMGTDHRVEYDYDELEILKDRIKSQNLEMHSAKPRSQSCSNLERLGSI
jgi:hypothetical protein